MFVPILLAVVGAPIADGPVEFGRSEIAKVAGDRAQHVHVRIAKGGPPEGYSIRCAGGDVTITGAGANGAMYGELEFAERVKMRGAAAWTEDASGTPYLRDRGMNTFLTLPWDYKRNDTDHDPAALMDPARWYFQNDDYWRTLFDLMARARLNWLDIHGTWDVSVTDAPNLYAYFIQSDKYPEVGVATEIKAANLRQLNKVIAMAHARGIRISLMAYQATLSIPQNPRPPYKVTEALLYDYTREVVEKMIRQAPGLDAIGFRIGESGKGEAFFNCYIEAVKRSGRKIPLITRSWLTRKRNILPLARAFPDFSVEIKYNGEQWGPPYMVAGGRMANWYSYSFEDYLSDSGAGRAAKTWAGNPTAEGARWPDEPYKVVWQVRANGTHRIFPFYEPDWVRKSILQMKIGTASGYTVEGLNAYYPASPDYYLANPADRYCDWVHQRDEIYWLLWGRLGYDPKTPEEVFTSRIREWFGPEGDKLAASWKACSRIIPTVYTAFSLGPDHRNHAPELEWGGTTDDFIAAEPFDALSFVGIREQLANGASGGIDGRTGLKGALPWGMRFPTDRQPVSLESLDASRVPEPSRKRFAEVVNGLRMLDHLCAYYRARMASAFAAAELEADAAVASRRQYQTPPMDPALRAWQGLSTSPEAAFYRPFTERLRMHTNEFHWRSELSSVRALGPQPTRMPGINGPVVSWQAPSAALTWKAEGDGLRCTVTGSHIQRAWLLHKPLPSTTFFHRTPMTREGDAFVCTLKRENWGHCLAAEAANGTAVVRTPSFLKGETPYLVVPARPAPTPPIYSSDEALRFLNPDVLTPERHGLILVGTRAWAFHRYFTLSEKRKILEPVQRGMTLLVLQQDYASGRYPLDWLPTPLRVVSHPTDKFDPGGALGLPKMMTRDLLWQVFQPSPGWEVFGNGGVAHLRYGMGHIWMVSARIQARLHIPHCAKALVALLKLGGTDKPVVLIDSGTEGADKCSSVIPDMMNSHDIPFLTLGEVVAQEQGMSSNEPVAGKLTDDNVLEGRGPEMLRAFLSAKVRAKAAVPTAPTRQAFEKLRRARKAEILRTLGLSPMPPKTPLNARITETVQRKGYRVENLVLESRPRFDVTAQVYVPDGPAGQRYPVIVNPIGHWQHKKAEPVVQARCIFEALHGYLAVVIDSPGWSFEGDTRIERRGEGTHDDLKLIQGGTNTTGYYVWDLIRTLDYVATRPDADTKHIGLTGASGGGLATLYAFAADDRYTCAVPVVYVSSMELAPDNGCLCNHVPGMLQVGDRSDVLGIQAPKPILIIGAQADGEFPPDAMRLTGKKAKKTWALFNAEQDVKTLIFPGGHDYNRPMREAALGFFDTYLKGIGDGAPVPEPPIETADPGSPEMFVLQPPPADERTLTELAVEALANVADVSLSDVVRVNGGLPASAPLNYREIGTGAKRDVVFDAEPGLQIPGILMKPEGAVRGVQIVACDAGKAAPASLSGVEAALARGYACLLVDVRGTGELAGIDQRYMAYLGTAVPFAQAWDLTRAATAMRKLSKHIEVVGRGPATSLAALYAALIDPAIEKVTGHDALREYRDVMRPDVPDLAVQPRANLCGSLAHLRTLVRNGEWHFLGE